MSNQTKYKNSQTTFDSPGSASLIRHSTNALRHIEKHSLFCSTYNSSKFCVMTPYYFGLKLIYRSFCISWCSFYQHSDNITAFRMGWSWHVVCTIFHRKILIFNINTLKNHKKSQKLAHGPQNFTSEFEKATVSEVVCPIVRKWQYKNYHKTDLLEKWPIPMLNSL